MCVSLRIASEQSVTVVHADVQLTQNAGNRNERDSQYRERQITSGHKKPARLIIL